MQYGTKLIECLGLILLVAIEVIRLQEEIKKICILSIKII